MTERKFLNKYDIKDKRGYGATSKDGLWRPLDIVDGFLIFQGAERISRKPKIKVFEKIEIPKLKVGRPRLNRYEH